MSSLPLTGRLGRYRIHGEVGKGGSGSVYRATDTDLDRTVAVKVLSPDLAGDPTWLKRFKREARTASQVSHPNIATLYSVEEQDGLHFITMEYLEGATLRSVMPVEGYRLEEFLRIAIPIVRALVAAHDRGITHRDLKPSNLFVTFDGDVKLLDFGIARLAPEVEENLTTMTQTAAFAGTAPYMSPEQIEGEPASPRSDLFSLGVVFFEMLTGSRPFSGRTVGTVCAAILNDPPDPALRRRGDLPQPLVDMVYACLDRSPDRRPMSSHRVLELLEALRDEITLTRPMVSRVLGRRPALRRRRLGWAALALAALVLASWGLFRVLGSAAGPPPSTLSATIPEGPQVPLRLTVAQLVDSSGASWPTAGLTSGLVDRLKSERGLEIHRHEAAVSFDVGIEGLLPLGRRHGADFLLLGELYAADGDGADRRARIELQLVDTSTEERVSLKTVETPLDDLFVVSRRLAGEVLDGVRAQTRETARAHIARNATGDEGAYRAYMQARSLLEGDVSYETRLRNLDQAYDLLVRSAGLDDQFADAWALSAMVALDLHRLTGDPSRRADGIERSLRAFALDEDSWLANVSRGQALRVEGRPAEALAYFDRYVELAPSHANSYASRASCRWQLQQWQGGLDDILRAVEIAPRAHDEAAARYLFHVRRYEEATRYLEQALADSPGDGEYVALLAEITLHRTADPGRAREVLFDMPGKLPEPLRFQMAFYHYLSRDYAAASQLLDSIESTSWELDLHSFPKALLEGLVRERLESGASARHHFERAIEQLRPAVEQGGDLRTLPTMAYALACAGRREEALDHARRARAMLADAVDQNNAGYQARQIAVAMARAGDTDGALELIAWLFERPAPISDAVLRIGPDWDPLRATQGFGEILAAHSR